VARAWREGSSAGELGGGTDGGGGGAAPSAARPCMHLIVSSPHAVPLPFELGLSLNEDEAALADTEGFLPLFDGSCEVNPLNDNGVGTRAGIPEYVCRRVHASPQEEERRPPPDATRPSVSSRRFRDFVAPLSTNVYRLGCPVPPSWNLSESANLVSNGGFENVQQAGYTGCSLWNSGCQHGWQAISSVDSLGHWTDSRAHARVSTASRHSGRHALRFHLPEGGAAELIKDIPLDGGKLIQLGARIGASDQSIHIASNGQSCLYNATAYTFEAWVRGGSQRWADYNGGGGVGGGGWGDGDGDAPPPPSPSWGRVRLVFGHYRLDQSLTDPLTPPTFVVASELGSINLTAGWQPLRVAIPAADRPCRVTQADSPGGAASLGESNGVWAWHFALILGGAARPGPSGAGAEGMPSSHASSVWLDDVSLVAHA
jgi:hypothetical protein